MFSDIRQFPKGICPSGNFPTVLFPKHQLPKFVLGAVLAPLVCSSHSGLPKLWEVAAWETAHLGSCQLSLGKSSLGKALWEKP